MSKIDFITTPSIPEEKKEMEVLESLRSTHEREMSSHEDVTGSIQRGRETTEQKCGKYGG